MAATARDIGTLQSAYMGQAIAWPILDAVVVWSACEKAHVMLGVHDVLIMHFETKHASFISLSYGSVSRSPT